jgi:hypothetical protein
MADVTMDIASNVSLQTGSCTSSLRINETDPSGTAHVV